MEKFEKVSLNDLSVQDLLLIIKALEYTNENTKLNVFGDLRNNLVKSFVSLLKQLKKNFFLISNLNQNNSN